MLESTKGIIANNVTYWANTFFGDRAFQMQLIRIVKGMPGLECPDLVSSQQKCHSAVILAFRG